MPLTHRHFTVPITVAATMMAGDANSRAHELTDTALVQHLVEQLGADSYLTRKKAEQRLLELASNPNPRGQRIEKLLRAHPVPALDLERLESKQRLLLKLAQNKSEAQMDRFLYDSAFDQSSIVGWDQFKQFAGSGIESRLVFAMTTKEMPGFGQLLMEPRAQPPVVSTIESIDRRDTAAWAILLSTACRRASQVAGEDSFRITATLRCPGTGPAPTRDHELRVVSELIESYLTHAVVDPRDRIVIALRYGCTERVEADCRTILSDPSESPSRIVTALLAASVLDWSPQEIDHWLASYREDSRVSHVWQSMAVPKTTHRTQVRDVAYALQLHRAGIDPRSKGFQAIVADPILVFRPYSLGFESEQTRRLSHQSP